MTFSEFNFRVRFVMPAKLFCGKPTPSVADRTMWGTATVVAETDASAQDSVADGYKNLGFKVLVIERV